MFERYNIDDLFLATINVIYPDNDMWEDNIGCMLMMSMVGYGYLTILKKEDDKYIDLNYMHRKITETRNPKTTSFIIDYIEPLSKYYNQDGSKNETFSRRKALKEAKQYYDVMHQEHLEQKQKKVII